MSYLYRSSNKKIVISFDYDHDRNYRYLLSALKENSGNTIDFEDLTPSAIDTNSVARVKGVLSTQISNATHLLVIIGAYANTTHPDSKLIGTTNWQWWEIEKAKELGKKLIAVKIEKDNPTPTPLLNGGASWSMSYTVEGILKAING
jgi:hypothetical protein